MKLPQWLTAGFALLTVIIIYFTTEKNIFGQPEKFKIQSASSANEFSIDSILTHAKENLTTDQVHKISLLEHSISRGDVKDQQLHIYHQLARFWSDSAKAFEPFAWYTAEAARLENSEKSLTFAARLFLNGMLEEANPKIKQWEALQAKDLFERSLKLNPDNDSAKIELGTVLINGGIAPPMDGVKLIRTVIAKDSSHVYALMTLGKASLLSGQLEKALNYFSSIARKDPSNLEAVIRAAETAQQMGNKKEAVNWYQKCLPYITMPEVKQEVEARIAELKK